MFRNGNARARLGTIKAKNRLDSFSLASRIQIYVKYMSLLSEISPAADMMYHTHSDDDVGPVHGSDIYCLLLLMCVAIYTIITCTSVFFLSIAGNANLADSDWSLLDK